jgi:hypothetical protein
MTVFSAWLSPPPSSLRDTEQMGRYRNTHTAIRLTPAPPAGSDAHGSDILSDWNRRGRRQFGRPTAVQGRERSKASRPLGKAVGLFVGSGLQSARALRVLPRESSTPGRFERFPGAGRARAKQRCMGGGGARSEFPQILLKKPRYCPIATYGGTAVRENTGLSRREGRHAFSSYDADGLRLLSHAHSEAMASLQRRSGRPFSDSEDADLSSRLVVGWSRISRKAYDSGVREPSAL